ncbi:hypothetical protein Hanom_Chr03g00206421 [Helianthus anomalus]
MGYGAWPHWREFEAGRGASKVTWRALNGQNQTHAPNPSPTIPHGREFESFHVSTNAPTQAQPYPIVLCNFFF